MKPRLAYLVTVDWYFCSHRLPLAVAAREAGYEVSVVTQVEAHGERIRDHGLGLVPVRFPRSFAHPLADLSLLAALPRIYRRLRPRLVHHVALKPVLYGSLAAALARVPATVNALAGLGYTFTSRHGRARLLRSAVRAPLRAALSRSGSCTIVQNADDARGLVEAGLLPAERVRLVRGSGVDLERFAVAREPAGTPVVLLPGRMLWDKGVGEFVEAARRLRERGVDARFVLIGDTDDQNPTSIPAATLAGWQAEGVVEWRGRRDDMPAQYAAASVVCLPSYREGLPKTLLEAAASGRAMVATDVPGCREVVIEGETGLRVPARDAVALADAVAVLLANAARRREMGAAARELAEREFSVARVNAETLAIYEQMLAAACRG